jgi:hypothetical protein
MMAPHLGHLPFLPVQPAGKRIRLWQLLQTINMPGGSRAQRGYALAAARTGSRPEAKGQGCAPCDNTDDDANYGQQNAGTAQTPSGDRRAPEAAVTADAMHTQASDPDS